jgi:hypothetical protein
LHPSNSLRERELLNENMVLDVLNVMSPEDFREELFTVLNKYHVEIVKTAGASGRPGMKTFRRSFGSAAGSSAAADASAAEAPAADHPAPLAPDPPAPPAPAQPEAAPAQPEGPPARGRGAKPKA